MATTAADPRNPATRQAAERALADREADAAAASAAVDEARERLALRRGTRGDLNRAQRALARIREEVEQARAWIRAVDRAATEAREEDADRRERIRAAEAAVLAEERDELAGQVAAFFTYADEQAEALDKAIAEWNSRAQAVRKEGGGRQPGWLNRPSNLGRPWGQFIAGLNVLRREFPAPKERA